MTHELSLISNLLNKIEMVAREQRAVRVTKVCVKLGALSHISADHFRGHFTDGVRGTLAEGAVLEIEESGDVNDPQAQQIVLKTIDVGDGRE